MTSPTTPTAGLPRGAPRRSVVWSVFVPFLAALTLMSLGLVLIVVIRPFGWRLLATLFLSILGIAALILFSYGLEQSLPGRRRHPWAGEVLHWLSASFVALALVVVLGAFVPSLLSLSVSPPFFVALGCDALIGLLAGLLTLGLTALSGWAAGELSDVALLRWSKEEQPERLRLSRDDWSLRDAIRIIVFPIVGVVLSAGFTQAFAAVPSRTAAAAADTAPKLPPVGSSIVLPVGIWFLTTGLVWFAFDWVARRNQRTRPQTAQAGSQARRSHLRRRRATHASALAIGLAIAIGWGFAFALDDVIQGSLATHGTVTAVSIRTVPAAHQEAYLAQRFVPQFELAQREPWQPTTVDWYVTHSQETKSQPFCGPGSQEKGGCRELCAIKAGANCKPVCDDADPKACAASGGSPHAVYYRYLDAVNTPKAHPAGSGHDWAVIEYWIFYNYDSLSAGPLITQWHQSDWEQVSVLTDRKGSTVYPVEVGFSEHCYGAAVPATEVSWNGSHPVSFVGLGSHANYPTQNDLPIRQLQCLTRQTPRYLGVAGLFFNPRVAGWSLELPIAYLIGLRDSTGTRTVADVKPISQQSTPSIWSFHGYWGIDNNLRILAGRVPTGAGPQSPQDQNPSLDPFKNMFCGSTWIKVSPTPATAWVC